MYAKIVIGIKTEADHTQVDTELEISKAAMISEEELVFAKAVFNGVKAALDMMEGNEDVMNMLMASSKTEIQVIRDRMN